MVGIFEVVNGGIQKKSFNGTDNYNLACLQNAELTPVKIADDVLLKQCQNLELYKAVKLRIEINKGQFEGKTYANYKLLSIEK